MKTPSARDLSRPARWQRCVCFTLALLLSNLPTAVLACIEWEYHENIVNTYTDVNGCWVDTYESWWEGWNGSTLIIEDQQTWDGDPYDCPEEPPPCEECEDDNGNIVCELPNATDVFRGDARRHIAELTVRGAAKRDFKWARYHSTSMLHSKHVFGSAGEWRHSWQYDLLEIPVAGSSQPELELILPTGRSRVFRPNAGGWAPLPFYQESVVATADGFEVTTATSTKLRFVRSGEKLQMRTMIDPHGLLTQLEYDQQGCLLKVTDPSGHFLQLKYRAPAAQRRAFALLGTLETAGAGWQQIDVPASLQNEAYRYVQIRLADHVAGAVAEVQFFAPGSDGPLTGRPFGSSEATAAFDDEAATSVASIPGQVNMWGLDLGADGASRFARVRVLAKPGQEAGLQGLLFDGYGPATGNERLLEEVTSSNGETVRYSYETYSDPWFGLQDTALARADYGDGSSAVYRYENIRRGGRPLLVEADDPRYTGKVKHVRYAYRRDKAVDAGFIYQEINPVTGGVYATLELDAANPDKRIVHYSDLRSVVLVTPKTTNGRLTERIDSLGRKTRWEYAEGGRGRLTATVDTHGRRSEARRDGRGDLIERTDAKGRKERVVRTAQGRVEKQTDSVGRETNYVYDARGRVTRKQSSDGKNLDLTYDHLGRVTSIRTPGGLARAEYNARGLKSKVTNAHGAVTLFAYDVQDRLSAITDALGRVTRSERNARGQLAKIIRPDGATLHFAYDKYGRTIAKTDAQGRTIKTGYDDLGRVTRQEDHKGGVTIFDYMELPQGCSSCTLAPQPSRIMHPDGSVEKRLYDSEGRLLAMTVAADTSAEATTTYTHDDDNNLVSVTDPLGGITRFTYDDENHRLTQTDPMGRVTKWSYDPRGNMLTITVPNGGVTRMTYDTADRLATRTDALGHVVRYNYDAASNLVEMTDATGKKTRYTYDGRRRTGTIYPDGKRDAVTYDPLGRPIKTVSPEGLETSTVYDTWDRPAEITQIGPGVSLSKTIFTYDTLGRRTSLTDPLGHTTRWTYDTLGNVLTATRPDGLASRNTYDLRSRRTSSTDEAGNTTRYEYNEAGDMTALIDAKGNTYRFTYDAQHRKIAMIYPDDSRETWTYDLAGNPTAYTTRAGQTKTIAYNSTHQPVNETWSINSAPNVTYLYNAAGQLVTLDNGNAALTYSYDGLGRLAYETSDLSALLPGLAPHAVGYAYDELGRRANLLYPERTKVSYAYDARSRLTVIESAGGETPASHGNVRTLAKYAYDANGRIAKLTRDNGVTTAYVYDMAGQLTDITHTHGRPILAGSRYTIDQLGRRTAQTREDGITETYSYDAISQLASVDYGSGGAASRGDGPQSETFVYDAGGNRTQTGRVISAAPTAVITYTSNTLNQYTQVTSSSLTTQFTYDANGNLTNDGKRLYGYDAQSRLVAVESLPVGGVLLPDSVRAEFHYDARNRCVLRKYYRLSGSNQWVLDTTESRALTYDTGWNLLSERALSGAQISEYFHGARTDEILLSNQNSLPVYPLADAVGSTVALTDQRGGVIERYRYHAYGQLQVFSSELRPLVKSRVGYRFLFTGREWLASVDLAEHRNRYYTPNFGRWISPDPIRLKAGDANLYRYVANQAPNLLDPSGLTACRKQPQYNDCMAGVGPALTSCVDAAEQAYADSMRGVEDMCRTPCNRMCQPFKSLCLTACLFVESQAQIGFIAAKTVAISGCGLAAWASEVYCYDTTIYYRAGTAPCDPGDETL